jgi:hypothetical protein
MGSIVVALSYNRDTPERTGINLAYSDTQWLLQVLALLALAPALWGMWRMENIKLTNQSVDSVVVLGRASVLLGTFLVKKLLSLTFARRRRRARFRDDIPPRAINISTPFRQLTLASLVRLATTLSRNRLTTWAPTLHHVVLTCKAL